ncbi:Rieske (2Fe-2S) protein [Trebonia sp.]|uniref:Rieske (2Fe-2S) protein n=1 Tax=Trebonia sp. TaxID=2767075 RepID=UPI0026207D3F|nr:Rieske (2Fe-2S) protein [Trebonia sp.]
MAEEPQQDQRATRRCVLLGAGLLGVGGVLAGCSTAAVPYDANGAGAAPAQAAPPALASSPATGAAAGSAGAAGAATGAGTATGTLLGLVTDIPVGGGTIFTSQQVVVTQPAKGVLKAFSAVCTHMGCLVNTVANGTIDCPCHGSEFKISNGAVVAGPAPAPLPARTIAVTDGKIFLL